MAFTKKGCFKCGGFGHLADGCDLDERVCFNCKKAGHEFSACTAQKNCYTCGGVGHFQADCATHRVTQNQKCYSCGHFGHLARVCPHGTGAGFASRVAPPSRGLNTSTLPPVKCYRCNGPNHLARDCLAAPGTTVDNTPTGPANLHKNKTCYKCQKEGHIARDCTENGEYVG